jgi:uncharacterized protein (DUF302 family)
MTTMHIDVERFTIISPKAFSEVVTKLNAVMGHPDMNMFQNDIKTTKTLAELEQVVHRAIGSSGLMEFNRFDLGEVLRRERGSEARQSLRLVVGNPLIMKEMVKLVPDAGSYAPVTILIDERSDGVHLSYDRMTTFLAPYGNPEALKVARDLDTKIEAMLMSAAAS